MSKFIKYIALLIIALICINYYNKYYNNYNMVNAPITKRIYYFGGGRLGNQLYYFIFWKLMSLQHGLVFTLPSTEFPYPFNNMMYTSIKRLDVGFLEFNEPVPEYPHNFKYYRNKRPLLIELLNINQYEQDCNITIHVRVEDVFNHHELYTLLPLSYYRDVFKTLKGDKICIIGHPIDELQVLILKTLANYVQEINPTSVIDSRIGKTIEEDFKTIMGSQILIGSTSSFWFWPAYLSTHVKELHIPEFGQMEFMGLLNTSDDYVKIITYPLPFKTKIKLNTVYKLFYDVYYNNVRASIFVTHLQPHTKQDV